MGGEGERGIEKEGDRKGGRMGRRVGRKKRKKSGPLEPFENFLMHLGKYFENLDNSTLYTVTYYAVLVCCLNHKLHANGLIHKPIDILYESLVFRNEEFVFKI